MDMAYLRLQPAAGGAAIVRQVEIGAGTVADLNAAGEVVGLEFFRASARFRPDELAGAASAEAWLTTAEAAAEAGLAVATIRQLIFQGKLAATKRGRDNLIARHELLNYLERRDGSPRADAARPARARRAAR